MSPSTTPWGRMIVGFALATLWPQALAISVASGSHCKTPCRGGDTGPIDLICSDSGYNSTSEGDDMKNCLLCQSASPAYSSETDNDLFWFLFNQKYTVQHCLFEESSERSLSPCEPECRSLESVFKTLWYPKPDANETLLYEYCTMNGGAFEKNWKNCRDCMRGKEESFILGNFIANMGKACEAKPDAANGETLDMPYKNLFETPLASATESATSSPSTTDSPESSGSSGLSDGASAGIGVGVGVGVIILLSALWFFVRRSRRNKQQVNQALPPVHDAYDDSKYASPQPPYSHTAVMSEAGGTSRSELPT